MRILCALGLLSFVALAGCGGGETSGAAISDSGIRAERGVDLEERVIRVGLLVDVSGPAASIGRPFVLGQRIFIERVNSDGSGWLPDGWRIELIERDHGYNPQRSVQAYNEIRDDVLYLALSFGTPTTLPIRPLLERDRMIAFPASLSTPMTRNRFTPMGFATYRIEAMRAMDFAVAEAGSPEAVRSAIVYQQDDFGQDGLDGWREAAAFHGVEIVSEQAISPGQGDFTANVATLRSSGANYVMISSLPSATSGLLGTARTLGYAPVWLGNTPSWGEEFFDPAVIPPEALANYFNISMVPYWGEDIPGMDGFLADFERFGGGARRDWYTLLAYTATMAGVEALKRAIQNGDLTPDGFAAGLASIDAFDAGGLLHEGLSFSSVPYPSATAVRVLKPEFGSASWIVESDYAIPETLGGGAH